MCFQRASDWCEPECWLCLRDCVSSMLPLHDRLHQALRLRASSSDCYPFSTSQDHRFGKNLNKDLCFPHFELHFVCTFAVLCKIVCRCMLVRSVLLYVHRDYGLFREPRMATWTFTQLCTCTKIVQLCMYEDCAIVLVQRLCSCACMKAVQLFLYKDLCNCTCTKLVQLCMYEDCAAVLVQRFVQMTNSGGNWPE